MKILLTLLLLLFARVNLVSQNKLCEECSKNSLGGFEYFQTSGDYNLGSAIGGLAYSPVVSGDGQYQLISGYMPICVLPIANIGKGDTVCSDNQTVGFTVAGYLTESAKWFVNGSAIQNQSYSYTPIITNTKDSNGYTERIHVELTKGKYIAESEAADYRENPSIDLEMSFPDKICRNNPYPISFNDRVFKSFQSVVWNNETGISFPYPKDKSKAVIQLESGEQTYIITFSNKFGCIKIDTFSVTSITPTATIGVKSPPTIRPSEVNKTEPNEIPIVFNTVENFNYGCAPDSAIIILAIRSSMFLPNENSTKSKITYDKSADFTDEREIKIEAKVPSSVENGSELAILEGWVLLGDRKETPITIKSIEWKGANISDNTVETSWIPGIIRIDCCGDNTDERLIDKASVIGIVQVSPMPTEGNEVDIEVKSFSEKTEYIEIMIFNSIGEKTGVLYSGYISKGTNHLEVLLPEGIQNGTYHLNIVGQSSSYPLIIVR